MTIGITPEQVAQDIKALGDSVTLIRSLIDANERTEETVATMDRNVRHIAIMCAKDYIQQSGADLTPFTDAAADGLEWMSAGS